MTEAAPSGGEDLARGNTEVKYGDMSASAAQHRLHATRFLCILQLWSGECQRC